MGLLFKLLFLPVKLAMFLLTLPAKLMMPVIMLGVVAVALVVIWLPFTVEVISCVIVILLQFTVQLLDETRNIRIV